MQTKNQLLLFADSNFNAVKFSHTLIYKKNYILNFPLPIKHSIGWTKQQKIANMNKLEEEGKNYKSQAEHACIPNCTSIVFDQKKKIQYTKFSTALLGTLITVQRSWL